jgi:hypothetical protein
MFYVMIREAPGLLKKRLIIMIHLLGLAPEGWLAKTFSLKDTNLCDDLCKVLDGVL